jgi:hypothetical protein
MAPPYACRCSVARPGLYRASGTRAAVDRIALPRLMRAPLASPLRPSSVPRRRGGRPPSRRGRRRARAARVRQPYASSEPDGDGGGHGQPGQRDEENDHHPPFLPGRACPAGSAARAHGAEMVMSRCRQGPFSASAATAVPRGAPVPPRCTRPRSASAARWPPRTPRGDDLAQRPAVGRASSVTTRSSGRRHEAVEPRRWAPLAVTSRSVWDPASSAVVTSAPPVHRAYTFDLTTVQISAGRRAAPGC